MTAPEQRRHPLENRIPPPVAVVLVAACMWGAARFLHALNIDWWLRVPVACALAASGVIVTALGVRAFRRARTTINPLNPEQASSVVTDSIYRYTRNPMYLGFAMMLVGWAIYLDVA